MNKAEILDLIAEMKAKAGTLAERTYYDGMAFHLITQEIEPLKMAQSLDHWIGRDWLHKSAPPIRV